MIQCEGCLAGAAIVAEADLLLLRAASELRLGQPFGLADSRFVGIALPVDRIRCA